MNLLEVHPPCTSRGCSVDWSWCLKQCQVVDGHSTRLRVLGSHFRPVAELRCGFASRQKRRNFLTCLGIRSSSIENMFYMLIPASMTWLPHSSVRFSMNHMQISLSCTAIVPLTVPDVSTYRIHNHWKDVMNLKSEEHLLCVVS